MLFTAVLGVVGAGKSLPLDLRPHTCDAGLVEWAGGRTVSPLSSVPKVQKILMGWRVGPPPLKQGYRGEGQERAHSHGGLCALQVDCCFPCIFLCQGRWEGDSAS